jgi:hypothetical protein
MDKNFKLVKTIYKINLVTFYSDDEKEKLRSGLADNN